MCTTSKRSSRRALIVRRAAAGSGAIGATEPFPAAGTDAPRGVTQAAGGGPSQGARTWASTPSARIALAIPITWPWTPPGMLKLYGHTIPTRRRTGPLPGLLTATRALWHQPR